MKSSSLPISRHLLILLALILSSLATKAQLPQCNLVYMNIHEGGLACDSLFQYDPSLPISLTNPAINDIRLPDGNSGLTVSPVLGSGSSTLTYYTCRVTPASTFNFWYYDPVTAVWVNTGHMVGSNAAINIGAGGGYIYSIAGLGFGTAVYRYDGTGDAVFVRSITDPFPYDIMADCAGNFYVMSNIGPFWNFTKYDPNGNVLQGYTVSNPNNYLLSGGMAIIGNDFYSDELNQSITHASIVDTTLTFDGETPTATPVGLPTLDLAANTGYAIGDLASCAAALLNTLPALSITATDTSVCAGTAVTFAGHSTGAGSLSKFRWLVNGAARPGATDSSYTYTPADNDTVSLQLITNSTCGGFTVTSPAIVIHVLPAPTVAFTLPPADCAGDTVVAAITVPANFVYQWGFGDATVISGTGAGPYELRWDSAGQHTVTLQAASGSCNTTPVSNTIDVRAHPTLQLSADNSTACTGDSVRITATSLNADIQWLPGTGYTLLEETPDHATVILQQNSSIQVSALGNNGCNSSSSIQLTTHTCCRLTMPNAFTPDGNGRNDIFRPLDAIDGHYKVASLSVWNRWGQKVFDAANPTDGWDGTFEGKAQELGVYTYLIEYTCTDGVGTFRMQGDVMLVR